MTMRDEWGRINMRDLDDVSGLLEQMADEIDRLNEEVLLLHNRTGDWSKGRSRALAGDNGSYQ